MSQDSSLLHLACSSRAFRRAVGAGGLVRGGVLAAAAWLLFSPAAAWADRLVLRNLTVISDKTVASFDEDGVRLSDGSILTWDEIERATVAPDKQVAFNQMLEELGTHLYRIRQRLAVEDYEGLLPHAEAVYPRYRQRRSATAYMVCQAVMWGRLAARRREEAIEPYIRCYELLRQAQGNTIELPGSRRLQADLTTGLTPDLLPVWFDAEAAQQSLDDVFQAVAQLSKPIPEGMRIYYGTLALTAGEADNGLKVLRGYTPTNPAVEELRDAALAQHEVLAGQPGAAVANLERRLEALSPETKPVGLYWLGRARLLASDERARQEGMLHLLRIAAVYGERHPDLAAAGLYFTMQELNASRAAGSAAVRKELLDRYGHTYFAARVKEQGASPRSK